MKKLLLLVIVVFAVGSFIFAAEKSSKPVDSQVAVQSILSGKITDKLSGEELAGVLVRIQGTDQECYTDFDGNFKFASVMPGDYKLDVELISYKNLETQKIHVGTKEAHELKINLEQAQ